MAAASADCARTKGTAEETRLKLGSLYMIGSVPGLGIGLDA